MGRVVEQTLGQAHRAGQLARITCRFCRITRHFEPQDLQRLVGDIAVRQLLGLMRCEQCRRQDYLGATLVIPTAAERNTIRVRRLVDVRYIRKVMWQDE